MRLIWTDKSVIYYIFVLVIFVCYICKSNTSPQAHFLNPMLLSKSRLLLTTTKSSTLSGFSLDLLGVTTCPVEIFMPKNDNNRNWVEKVICHHVYNLQGVFFDWFRY